MSQPDPKPNDLRPVWEQVIEDMRARDQLGRERYGTPLQPFNGRDAATDEYEEALDRIVYAKQRIIETREMKTRLLAAIEQIATLEREAERNRNDGEKRLAHWERLLLDEEKRANAAEAALSASQERERRMRSVLERLNRKGGLGYELHDEITAALAPAPETATVTPRATESWMPCGAPVGNTGYACSLPAGHDGHWYIGPRVAKSTPAAPETPKASDSIPRSEVLRLIREQPYAADTKVGTRQQWVKDQLAAKVEAWPETPKAAPRDEIRELVERAWNAPPDRRSREELVSSFRGLMDRIRNDVAAHEEKTGGGVSVQSNASSDPHGPPAPGAAPRAPEPTPEAQAGLGYCGCGDAYETPMEVFDGHCWRCGPDDEPEPATAEAPKAAPPDFAAGCRGGYGNCPTAEGGRPPCRCTPEAAPGAPEPKGDPNGPCPYADPGKGFDRCVVSTPFDLCPNCAAWDEAQRAAPTPETAGEPKAGSRVVAHFVRPEKKEGES